MKSKNNSMAQLQRIIYGSIPVADFDKVESFNCYMQLNNDGKHTLNGRQLSKEEENDLQILIERGEVKNITMELNS